MYTSRTGQYLVFVAAIVTAHGVWSVESHGQSATGQSATIQLLDSEQLLDAERLPAGKDLQSRFVVARENFDQRQYQAAAKIFGELIDLDSADPMVAESRFYLAEAFVQLRRYREAAVSYQAYLASGPVGPNAIWAQFRAGETAYFLQQDVIAERSLVEFLRTYDDHDLATNAQQILLKLALDDFDAWRKSGVTEKLAASERRLRACLTAHLHDQNDILARYWLGRVMFEQKDYESASEVFLAAISLARGHDLLPNMLAYSGESFCQLGDIERAAECFQRLITGWPQSSFAPEAEYRLGQCWFGQGALSRAHECWRHVLRSTNGENIETAAKAQWQIAKSFQHQGRFDHAAREYLRLATIFAESTDGWQERAFHAASECYELLGDVRSAQRMANQARELAAASVREAAKPQYIANRNLEPPIIINNGL